MIKNKRYIERRFLFQETRHSANQSDFDLKWTREGNDLLYNFSMSTNCNGGFIHC
jgi:hypothetical protein